MKCQTYRMRSQIDYPEEISVAATARNIQICYVFSGVQQTRITVRFQVDDQFATTVVP